MAYNILKQLLFLSFFLLFNSTVIGQVANPCGTKDGERIMERLRANKKWLKNNEIIQIRSNDTIYVPVKFHLYAQNDGTGRIEISDVIQQMCDINQELSQLGIVFYIKDGFNLVNHTITYENPTSLAARNKILIEKNNRGRNAMNVIITQNAQTGSGGGTTLGYYQPGSDYIVVRKSEIGIGSGTLAHEIGHYFSLAHPHRGWEDDPWNVEEYGTTVMVTSVSSSQTSFQSVAVELADGANCETAGDEVCDTPADYNFGLPWPSSCPPFNEVVFDRNGVQLDPMQDNVMSYFQGCEPYLLTEMQGDLVIADYNSPARSEIRSDYIPNANEIVEVVELIEPGNNETATFYNSVFLDWSEVEHADNYLLEISGGGDSFSYILSDSEFLMEELSPNKIYTWTVLPFNETGGCASKRTNILRTNDINSSIEDLSFIDRFLVYPSPSSGNRVSLLIESTKSFTSIIKIYNFQGQSFMENNLKSIQPGLNQFKIETSSLTNGIYFIHLITEEGTAQLKFLIQK